MVRVVDGDTLVVQLDGVDTTVRLLNVDAPDTKDPSEAVQCLGPEASEFLTELLPAGTPVDLEYDGEKLDRYGRTLAGVWLPESLVNAEIARVGLGTPVQFNGQVRFLPPAEEAAAAAKLVKAGAYADDVSCALPAQVDEALSALQDLRDPSKKTSTSYAAAIASLTSARRSASEVASLARAAKRTTGAGAWVFHDAVRTAQLKRVEAGIKDADERLGRLVSTAVALKKDEAARGSVSRSARRLSQSERQSANGLRRGRRHVQRRRRSALGGTARRSGAGTPPEAEAAAARLSRAAARTHPVE